MNGMIRWLAGNTVAANLLMLTIAVAGIIALTSGVRRELFPEVSLDVVRVSVIYPGATPTESESGIVLRIEEAVSDLPGIDKMTSTATEGSGSVTLEVDDSYDVRAILDDVKTRVDAITSFPEEAERATVEAPTIRRRVVGLTLSGELNTIDLRKAAEQVRDDLLAIPGITQVDLSGTPAYEIGIEVSEDVLRRYGLSFDEVRRAVSRASLDLPAGSIKRTGGEILLRTKGQAYTGAEFGEVVLRSDAQGGLVKLGDVADIHDGFADVDVAASLNGHNAVVIAVSQVGDQDILGIADSVHSYIAESKHELPPGISLSSWDDTSVAFQQRMDTLTRNAIGGLVLVFIALALFLRLRLAFWVTLGIPLSFLGALWVMPHADASFNMISMFAFILVLGIVVDDAIVVGEAIHTDQDEGKHGLKGAISGTLRVARPVLFAVATSMIAFAPMLFISGTDGRFWLLIPIVVISCLFFSLVESLMILPAHLSHEPPQHKRPRWSPLYWMDKINDGVDSLLETFIRRIYRPLMVVSLRWRYLAIACFLAMFLVGIGLILGGLVRWIGFPRVDADNISVQVDMPPGTHISTTEGVVDRIAAAVNQLRKEFDGDHPDQPVIGDLLISHGVALGASMPMSGSSSSDAELRIDCPNLLERGVSVLAISRRWEQLVGEIPGAKGLTFSSDLGGHGRGVSVRLNGTDLDELKEASRWLQHELAGIDGIYQIQDDFSEGKEEFTLRITPEAQTLGLRLDDLARQVRRAFYGVEVQRIQRGRDEVKVMVRYPEHERRSVQALHDMRIRTASGEEVPFASVATIERVIGAPTIRRRDRARMIKVEAEIDAAVVDNEAVNTQLKDQIFAELKDRFPGVETNFGGRTERQQRAFGELIIGLCGALFGMYALMAVAFRSYLQPALIMTAIPFGLVGALLGHLLLGMHLSMLSFMGIIALAGVVVNDNLVLIDAINRLRDSGMSVPRAVLAGASSRLRAVILTTLTTFLGLLPLMTETSTQAQFLIPMGVSLAFGVLFASGITLILVPVIYLVLEDLRWVFLDPSKLTKSRSGLAPAIEAD